MSDSKCLIVLTLAEHLSTTGEEEREKEEDGEGEEEGQRVLQVVEGEDIVHVDLASGRDPILLFNGKPKAAFWMRSPLVKSPRRRNI